MIFFFNFWVHFSLIIYIRIWKESETETENYLTNGSLCNTDKLKNCVREVSAFTLLLNVFFYIFP